MQAPLMSPCPRQTLYIGHRLEGAVALSTAVLLGKSCEQKLKGEVCALTHLQGLWQNKGMGMGQLLLPTGELTETGHHPRTQGIRDQKEPRTMRLASPENSPQTSVTKSGQDSSPGTTEGASGWTETAQPSGRSSISLSPLCPLLPTQCLHSL